MKPAWIISKALDVGLKRKGKPNQDAAEIFAGLSSSTLPPLLVLADGMGGHAGGELASQLVVGTVLKTYSSLKSIRSPAGTLKKIILAAHTAIRETAAQQVDLAEMGSTIVLALLGGDQVSIANVGDSRAYLIREGNIEQLSRDQSVVAELVRRGIITAEQSLTHPYRNRLTMSISAMRTKLEILTSKVQPQPGDCILLCSDGLWGVVPEAEVCTIAYKNNPQKATRTLVNRANSLGGPDNISVIIAKRAIG